MTERRINVFYYGSIINLDVLRQVDLIPESTEVASLADWEIRIQPLATIRPKSGSKVYGIVAKCCDGSRRRIRPPPARSDRRSRSTWRRSYCRQWRRRLASVTTVPRRWPTTCPDSSRENRLWRADRPSSIEPPSGYAAIE